MGGTDKDSHLLREPASLSVVHVEAPDSAPESSSGTTNLSTAICFPLRLPPPDSDPTWSSFSPCADQESAKDPQRMHLECWLFNTLTWNLLIYVIFTLLNLAMWARVLQNAQITIYVALPPNRIFAGDVFMDIYDSNTFSVTFGFF